MMSSQVSAQVSIELVQYIKCLPLINVLLFFQSSPCPNLVKTTRNNLPPFFALFFVRVKNFPAILSHRVYVTRGSCSVYAGLTAKR